MAWSKVQKTCFSSAGKHSLPRVWQTRCNAVPAVSFPEGSPAPTALQWLRRKGPPVPISLLHRLIRRKQIKQFSPSDGTIRSLSRTGPLAEGVQLLVPKEVEDAANMCKAPRTRGGGQLDAKGAAVACELKASMLHQDRSLLIVNKPAGLATQGGNNIRHSLDSIAAHAFKSQTGEPPRLCHRLDRETTGAICLARTAEAAAWLSAAFAEKASGQADSVVSVSRSYLALTAGRADIPSAGWVNAPLRGPSGELVPASTGYEVLARAQEHEGLSTFL
eukprot:jgi/Astpho2/4947/Aster-x1267